MIFRGGSQFFKWGGGVYNFQRRMIAYNKEDGVGDGVASFRGGSAKMQRLGG